MPYAMSRLHTKLHILCRSHDIGTWLSNCYMTFNHDCQIVTWHSTLTVKEIVTWHLALNWHTNCLMTFNPWLSMKLSHDIQPLNVTLIVTWHSTLTVNKLSHDIQPLTVTLIVSHDIQPWLSNKLSHDIYFMHDCTHTYTYIHANTINVTWHWPVHSLCLRSQWHQSARLTTGGLDSWCSQ